MSQPNEIVDRRNQMIGNVSVLQDLETLAIFERILERKGFVEDVWKEYGYSLDNWVKIRFVHMSREVQDSLDYPSKLSRHPDLIHKLMEDGERQAREFLESLVHPANTIEEATRKLRGEL